MHLQYQVSEHCIFPEGQHTIVQSALAHQSGNLCFNTIPQICSITSLCFTKTEQAPAAIITLAEHKDEMKS